MASKLFDLIFFGRPLLIIPVWTVYLHFMTSSHPALNFVLIPSVALIMQLVALTLVFKGVYVFNQLFDIESDRINDKLHFLPRGIISVKTAWIYYSILTLAGLVVALTVSKETFFITAAITVLGVLYSVPGIRLKDRAVSGLLANSIAYGLLVPMTLIPDRLIHPEGLSTIPYFLAIATGYVLTTIPDREGDAVSGKRTIAVIIGIKGSLILALLLGIATLVSSYLTANQEMQIVAVVTTLLIIGLLIHYRPGLMLFACKFPILLLTLLACIHAPFYFPVLLLTIVLTRVYYKYRFEISYPRLR